MDDRILASLEQAVATNPDDVPLRLHLAEAYAESARHDDAVRHAAAVLAVDPQNAAALTLVARRGRLSDAAVLAGLETQFETQPAQDEPVQDAPVRRAGGPRGLVDVAGMTAVKARLEQTFLAPLRNPDVAALYGMRAGGGLLLYGPPGCGKTYVARAVAAEIGAQMIEATVADLYSKWLGESEQNVAALYEEAARRAPCVVFLDEIDALAQKRSALRGSAARGAVNQLLVSMDGTADLGVLTIAATNHPWDVDPALLRPGRIDRRVLVEPPDREARAQVIRIHLRDRPVEDLDVLRVADATADYSGADLAHLVTTAVQAAFADALATGRARPVTTADLLRAATEVKPSTIPWIETAQTVVRYAGRSGEYDELREYLRRTGRT